MDNLEGPFRTLYRNIYVFGAHHENLNEDRPTLSAAKMYPNDYDNMFRRIFAWVPEGASNDIRVVENDDFQCFCSLFLQEL